MPNISLQISRASDVKIDARRAKLKEKDQDFTKADYCLGVLEVVLEDDRILGIVEKKFVKDDGR